MSHITLTTWNAVEMSPVVVLISLVILSTAGTAALAKWSSRFKKKGRTMQDQTPTQFPGNGEPDMSKPMCYWTDAEWDRWWAIAYARDNAITHEKGDENG